MKITAIFKDIRLGCAPVSRANASSAMTTTAVPEMGRYLRQIVDNSFEEGQFESAVAMLDQLRSKDHKPSM